MPLVSVLTTSYNRPDYIAAAIESVLSSSFTDFEYIIVDDCSKDNTVDIAKSYEKLDNRIKVYVNEKNLGDYKNRNKAAGFAKGKYIKYLDSDDIMYNHCLQAMVYSMEKFPEAGFGLSASEDPKSPYPVSLSPKNIYLEHFNGYGHFNRAPGSAIIKREAFENVGGFSGRRFISDYELWFKLANQYPLVKFSNALCWDRIHGNQERTTEKKEVQKLRRQIMLEALDSEECPLDENEKNAIYKTMKKQNKKQLLVNLLSNFK
jgi:glycosyltransferase involved in cell wall biosynthesis